MTPCLRRFSLTNSFSVFPACSAYSSINTSTSQHTVCESPRGLVKNGRFSSEVLGGVQILHFQRAPRRCQCGSMITMWAARDHKAGLLWMSCLWDKQAMTGQLLWRNKAVYTPKNWWVREPIPMEYCENGQKAAAGWGCIFLLLLLIILLD